MLETNGITEQDQKNNPQAVRYAVNYFQNNMNGAADDRYRHKFDNATMPDTQEMDRRASESTSGSGQSARVGSMISPPASPRFPHHESSFENPRAAPPVPANKRGSPHGANTGFIAHRPAPKAPGPIVANSLPLRTAPPTPVTPKDHCSGYSPRSDDNVRPQYPYQPGPASLSSTSSNQYRGRSNTTGTSPTQPDPYHAGSVFPYQESKHDPNPQTAYREREQQQLQRSGSQQQQQQRQHQQQQHAYQPIPKPVYEEAVVAQPVPRPTHEPRDAPQPRPRRRGHHEMGNEQVQQRLGEICNPGDPTQWYRNLSVIGKGASGSVYTAYEVGTNKCVAVKQMELLKQPKKDLIVNEIIVMKGSKHKNIVNFLDSYLVGGDLWVIMEYMEGGSLTDVVTFNMMSEGQIAAVCREVSSKSALEDYSC